ncbi:uncharacterized protein LOC133520316 [Cydia pomonella]|uniref:uncharacterized protein LOC133520316 n=1 Tax=Cydia pomonella TaxID=82600 RepID=UPI002ADD44D5|nr:uncharacterized protein LOC133520316 [Cydia pomonella]
MTTKANRSPSQTTGGGGGNPTGSQPDLSKLPSDNLVNVQNSLRKRKQPNFEEEIKNDLSEFHQDLKKLMDMCRSHKSDLLEMKSDVSDIKDQLANIKSTTENIITEHNQIKADVAEIKESLDFHSKRQDALNTRVVSIELSVKKMDVLDQEVSLLKKSHEEFQLEHYILQQRDRLLNLEIVGIPENKNENLSTCVINICKAAGVDVIAENIVHVNRVQPRTEVTGRPRNIVVQLSSLLVKDSIIAAIRKKKGITTTDIGLPGEPLKIYINEHLIPFYKQLRKDAKNAADAANYKYVWVRNCKIFVRKSDKSPIIYVRDASDLKKIR